MIHDLPDHVWTVVFDQLEFPFEEFVSASEFQHNGSIWEFDGLEALSRLCRTCSRFLRLAQPVLYRSLPLSDFRAHKRILSSLHEHPHLALCARNVALGEGVFSRDEITSLLLPYYSKAPQQILSRSEGLQARLRALLNGPEWPDGVPDIWFAHCATLMPNLKLLKYATRNGGELFLDIIRKAAKSEANEPIADARGSHTSPLSKLEEFCISNQDTEFAVRLRHIQDLFFLPRLRTFRGWAVDLDTHLATGTPQQRSSLRHAYLCDSLAEADGICDLLRACPFLQTLTISWGSATVGDSDLDFDHIGRVLREHGTGLEILDLDCRECQSFEEGEWVGKIGNLQALSRLKHLSVPEAILLGSEDELMGMDEIGDDDDDDAGVKTEVGPISTDSLEPLMPESLESLRLYSGYDNETWVRDSVQGILTSQRLTRLKKVQVDGGATFDVEWDKTTCGWRCKTASGDFVFYR